jgi:glycosyltransferase involved in cell wall biosynthesis/putative flippase GtrA
LYLCNNFPVSANTKSSFVLKEVLHLLLQLFRFAVTGLLNTLVDFGVFNLLIWLWGATDTLTISFINLLSVSLAIINSFFLNRHWTFASSGGKGRLQFQRFLLASLAGAAINTTTVFLLSSLLSQIHTTSYLYLNAAKVLGTIFSAGWNFWAYRNWVFSRDKSAQVSFSEDYVPGLTSVVIPAFNESKRLPARLQELAALLPGLFPVEIIVVDDGSNDHTGQIARSLAEKNPCIRCLGYDCNQGKGKAVQTGMLAARGEYLLYTDADHTFTPQHIEQILQRLRSGSQVVIARRNFSAGTRLEGESPLRGLMGRGFNRLVQFLLLPGIADSQCGLKGFQREAARKLFTRQHLKGFAFDVELLALARVLNLEICEQVVEAIDCPGSSVNRILTPLQMARDVLRLKIALMTNRYDLPTFQWPWKPVLLAMALFLLALAIRLPWLWEFPRFIDELKEVQLAYLIYYGQSWPLHNAAHDIGAMHNYILAAIFKIAGPNIYWPRLYVAITSSLSVYLVYRLGKHLFGESSGLIAALFLLTNGMHILLSHMAWANCTTPFFFTLALLVTLKSEQKKSGRLLVLAAFLWAATLQTHSSVIIYLLVVVAYLAVTFRNSAIPFRYYLAAAFSFLFGYFNMIYYNLLSYGGSFKWINNKSYALEQNLSINSYLHNMAQLLVELIRSVTSIYRNYGELWHYSIHPLFILSLFLIGTGAYFSIKEKKGLPLWLLLGGVLIMPLFNKRYVFYLATRYIMPLLICALILLAYGLVQIIRRIQSRTSQKKAVNIITATLILLLATAQVFPYYSYCSARLNTNESNRLALEVVKLTRQMSQGHESIVLIDDKLPLENQPLPYLLTFLEHPYQMLDSKKSWDNDINRYSGISTLYPGHGQQLIMVMNEENFRNWKFLLHERINRVERLSCQISFPAPASRPRSIFVVEINDKYSQPVFQGKASLPGEEIR